MTIDHRELTISPGAMVNSLWSSVIRHVQGREKTNKDWLFPPPDAETTATYCLPSFPWYVMGVAVILLSTFVDQSSLPVRESKARKRLSLVAPMKTRPPA